MTECVASHSTEIEKTVVNGEPEEVTLKLPMMAKFKYRGCDSQQNYPLVQHMVVECGEPEESDGTEERNASETGEESLLDEDGTAEYIGGADTSQMIKYPWKNNKGEEDFRVDRGCKKAT